MNWGRIFLGLVLAVVIASGASYFVYQKVRQVAVAQPTATGRVVVAASALPLGTRLQASQLRLIPWPAGDPLPGMFMRVEDCVDRALTSAVVPNEPILEGKLAPVGAGGGMPATIPEGMRAVSVSVNDVIGVAGFVQPGTVVDVLVTGSAEGSSGSITRTILEDIRVLAAGQKTDQDKDGKPQTVTVITLLVSPSDANKLALASSQGKIQLALRNAIDAKKTDPPSVFQAELFRGTPPPAPRTSRTAKAAQALVPTPAPAAYTVEVLRGGKREVQTFPNQ